MIVLVMPSFWNETSAPPLQTHHGKEWAFVGVWSVGVRSYWSSGSGYSVMPKKSKYFNVFKLKALIQPACFADAISWLAFVVAIFMSHENSDDKGQPRGDTCKVCWLN